MLDTLPKQPSHDPYHISLLRYKPLGAIGTLVLGLLLVLAIFADQIALQDPISQQINRRLEPPSSEFFFGTDSFGRDVFSRVIHGSRISLAVGIISVALAIVIGAAAGIASAYFGGNLDLLLQRFVDVILAFPALILALILIAAIGSSTNTIILAISSAMIPLVLRLTRSTALSIRQELYVQAAHALGASPYRIMARHIFPNVLSPILVLIPTLLEMAVIAESSLSFLGLGVPPPTPSWGRMLQEGTAGFLEAAPWLTLFPAAALSLLVFSLSVIGDALRDLFDPRSFRAARSVSARKILS